MAPEQVALVDASLASHLVQFAVVIILGLNMWLIRTVQQTREAARSFAQWAFGESGQTGANETLRVRGAALVESDRHVAALDNRIKTVETAMVGLEDDMKIVRERTHDTHDALTPIYVKLELPLPERRHGGDRRAL